jgi:ubiquinone/menaquinone biosynthesis C-methylase UbiE
MEQEFLKYKKFGAYHWKQYEDKNTKYSRHADRVKEWVKEKNVLDVGCGDGMITSLLNCKGIDNEPISIQLAIEKGVDAKVASVYELPYQAEEFDSVFCGDVLEHLENPEEALKEMRRVLKEYLYLATPTKGTQNDPYHIKEWEPGELKTLVESQGFKLVGDILTVLKDKRIYGKFQKTS